jgi:hypothetical protein
MERMDGHGLLSAEYHSCTAHLRALSFFPNKSTSMGGKRMVWKDGRVGWIDCYYYIWKVGIGGDANTVHLRGFDYGWVELHYLGWT